MINLKQKLRSISQHRAIDFIRQPILFLIDIFCYLPLVFRALLIIPLVFILCFEIIIWINKEPLAKPVSIVDTRRIQHPNYHIQSRNALSAMRQLPPIEQRHLIDNLRDNLWSIERWKHQFKTADNSIICLGESHLEATRQFIAQKLFNTLRIDDLYLEATAPNLKLIEKALATNNDYYPLLDANILATLRSAKNINQDIQLYPIEASSKQMNQAKKGLSSREKSIFNNFLTYYQPQARRVVLIGGLHCANKAHWFFKQLNQKQWLKAPKLFNTQIFNEHQDGPIEAFVYFLDEIGIIQEHRGSAGKRDFAIADTRAFSNLITRWFALSQQITFKPYQSIIIYRSRALNEHAKDI